MPEIAGDTMNIQPADSLSVALNPQPAVATKEHAPFVASTCHAADAPSPAAVTQQHFTIGKAPSSSGMYCEPRPQLPGYDTGVMCMLIFTFLILSANFRHYSTFVKTFTQNLWKIRNRSNIFDDHTMSETRVMASFILVLCLSEGILVFSTVNTLISGLPIFGTVAMITSMCIGFYIWQVMVYNMVGYTFTSTENRTQWVKGFKASQALLGIGLVVPALIVLFNPGTTAMMTITALALYVISRIIFIFKGFRIFYINSFSLIYFILYLCTLEILPPIMLCRAVVKLSLLL